MPKVFSCAECAAPLDDALGAGSCPYCSAPLVRPGGDAFEELDFEEYFERLAGTAPSHAPPSRACSTCGACLSAGEGAAECAYCGSPLPAGGEAEACIRPRLLLPFALDAAQARGGYRDWIASRWFAPNDLKSRAADNALRGVYMPCWTFDCATRTRYEGQRGVYYDETETYTVEENGETVTKTRQVRKTAWYPADGLITRSFDDVLVLASDALPRKLAEALEPWDLERCEPYQPERLEGFQVERYSVGLGAGFAQAKERMAPSIEHAIHVDIGGDEQAISARTTSYSAVTFKLILLPLWIFAYRYREQTYQVLINARSGEIHGQRPYSWLKIGALVAVLLALVVGGVWFARRTPAAPPPLVRERPSPERLDHEAWFYAGPYEVQKFLITPASPTAPALVSIAGRDIAFAAFRAALSQVYDGFRLEGLPEDFVFCARVEALEPPEVLRQLAAARGWQARADSGGLVLRPAAPEALEEACRRFLAGEPRRPWVFCYPDGVRCDLRKTQLLESLRLLGAFWDRAIAVDPVVALMQIDYASPEIQPREEILQQLADHHGLELLRDGGRFRLRPYRLPAERDE